MPQSPVTCYLCSALLRLSFLEKLDVAQGVGGNDAADGSNAVGSVDYFFVRVQYEICGVDNPSPLFPKGAYFVCIPGHFKSVGHRKSKLQFVHGLLGLIQRIHGKGHHLDVLFLELLDV
jgi:hypothetical protein